MRQLWFFHFCNAKWFKALRKPTVSCDTTDRAASLLTVSTSDLLSWDTFTSCVRWEKKKRQSKGSANFIWICPFTRWSRICGEVDILKWRLHRRKGLTGAKSSPFAGDVSAQLSVCAVIWICVTDELSECFNYCHLSESRELGGTHVCVCVCLHNTCSVIWGHRLVD